MRPLHCAGLGRRRGSARLLPRFQLRSASAFAFQASADWLALELKPLGIDTEGEAEAEGAAAVARRVPDAIGGAAVPGVVEPTAAAVNA